MKLRLKAFIKGAQVIVNKLRHTVINKVDADKGQNILIIHPKMIFHIIVMKMS